MNLTSSINLLFGHLNVLFGHLLTYLNVLNFPVQRTRRKLQLPANSNDDNGHDKGSSTNLLSVVGSTPLKAVPNAPTESPLKPQAPMNQEKTRPEKVDELG